MLKLFLSQTTNIQKSGPNTNIASLTQSRPNFLTNILSLARTKPILISFYFCFFFSHRLCSFCKEMRFPFRQNYYEVETSESQSKIFQKELIITFDDWVIITLLMEEKNYRNQLLNFERLKLETREKKCPTSRHQIQHQTKM